MSDRENFATYATAERFTSSVYTDLLKYIQKKTKPKLDLKKQSRLTYTLSYVLVAFQLNRTYLSLQIRQHLINHALRDSRIRLLQSLYRLTSLLTRQQPRPIQLQHQADTSMYLHPMYPSHLA